MTTGNDRLKDAEDLRDEILERIEAFVDLVRDIERGSPDAERPNEPMHHLDHVATWVLDRLRETLRVAAGVRNAAELREALLSMVGFVRMLTLPSDVDGVRQPTPSEKTLMATLAEETGSIDPRLPMKLRGDSDALNLLRNSVRAAVQNKESAALEHLRDALEIVDPSTPSSDALKQARKRAQAK